MQSKPSNAGPATQSNQQSLWHGQSTTKTTGPGAKKYDTDKFYTKATNEKGFGEKVSFKIPPEVYGRAGNLVNKDFPEYQSIPDVLRDIIAHGLSMREEQSGSLEILMYAKPLRDRMEMRRQTEVEKDTTEFFASLEKEIDIAMVGIVNDKAWMRAVNFLSKMAEKVAGQPEPYRGNILKQIDKWVDELPMEEQIELRSTGKGSL